MITRHKHACGLQVLGLAAAFLSVGPALNAADSPATNAAPKIWDTTAAAGLTLTRGNSDTLLMTLGVDTKAKWDKNELGFGASGGYGENKVNGVNTKNTEFIQGYGQ